MLLKELIKKDLCNFYNKADNWEDAISKSCTKLIKDGAINNEYIEELIGAVKKHGPYICIAEGIAMPHSTEGGVNVFKTEIGFTKFEEPVYFDEENQAQLFFTLASANPEIHLENMQKLMEVLENEELVEELFKVKNIDDVKKLSEKYNM